MRGAHYAEEVVVVEIEADATTSGADSLTLGRRSVAARRPLRDVRAASGMLSAEE